MQELINSEHFKVCVRSLIYNHEKYINDCLQGFLMQETTFPVVYLLEDDASTDNTQEILRDFVLTNFNTDDKSVARVIDFEGATTIFAQHRANPNIYVAYVQMKYNHYGKYSRDAYNREWLTSANYIALCEGDDYWTDPYKLQKQVEYMETHLTCSLCFHKVGIVSEKAGDVNLFASLEERDYSEREIYETWIVPTCSVVYRYVPDLQKHLSVPLVYGDIYLFLSLLKYGTAHCLNFEGAAYRRHEGSITWNMSVESLRMLLEQYKMMEQQFPNVKDITIQNEKNYLNRLFARQSEMDGDSIWKYRLWMCRLYPYLYFQRYFLITLYKYMLKVYCKRWFSYRKK